LVIWPVKIVPEMTYYVSSGTLNPTHSLTHSIVSSERNMYSVRHQKRRQTYSHDHILYNKTELNITDNVHISFAIGRHMYARTRAHSLIRKKHIIN